MENASVKLLEENLKSVSVYVDMSNDKGLESFAFTQMGEDKIKLSL